MTKFHYKVELIDGTIAKRSSHRVYTHLIEISPRSLESFVEEMNETIRYWTTERDRMANMDIEKLLAERYEEQENRLTRIMGLSADEVSHKMAVYRATINLESLTEDYAHYAKRAQARIDRHIEMRDVAIADGHPTVGDYFAGFWCGSLQLAEKKMRSQDVRYWVDKGRTARIVPTISAEQQPVYL